MRTLNFLLILCFCSLLRAQSDYVAEARREVDTLCSPYMAGRGYIGDGHRRAAEYLAGRFQEVGLTPLQSGTYLQGFPIRINLIKDARLTINGQALEPGADFIVHGASGAGTVTGKGKKNKVLLIRQAHPDSIARAMSKGASALLIVQDKLTASFSDESLPIPIIEVRSAALPAAIKSISLSVAASLTDIRTQNVLGLVRGRVCPDSVVILSAHYDHLGQLGPAIFTGANDNASGVALLLSLAEYFADPAHQPRCSILFIAFGAEETGLNGSRYYVQQAPLHPLSRTRFVLNLDLMGNGTEGITAVGGIEYPAHFQRLVALNDSLKAVPKINARKNAPNSDHYFFLQKGVPGMFLYTLGGPKHYHDVNDTPANLELSKFTEIRGLLVAFLEGM